MFKTITKYVAVVVIFGIIAALHPIAAVLAPIVGGVVVVFLITD